MADLLRAVPRPQAGIDLRGLDLTAEQAFVFSRLDGSSTVADVCAMTGLGEATTIGALRHLRALGLIAIDGLDPEPAEPRRSSPPPPPLPSSPPGSPPARSGSDPGIDLAAGLRVRIREVHESLTTSHFYALLGVPHKADRKAIREAYFRLSKEFHPDSYFGRQLGDYKGKLEAIFRRLTEAYGILTHKEKRGEYDVYIADQIAAAEMEERLLEADREAARIHEEIERARVEAAIPKRDASEVEALRRQALMQKLSGGRKFTPAPVIPAPAPAPRDPKLLADAIRRVIGAAPAPDERKEKAAQCADAARRALAAEDFVSAVNAWNLAATLDPSNADFQKEREESSRKARGALAVTYAKQGRYEESLGHVAEACRNWLKAADGQPSNPLYLERAAAMLVATRGDLHRAQELARKAVEFKPEDPAYRVTLGVVYEAAGLPRNAKREADSALAIDPHFEAAQALLKRIRKVL